MLINTPYNAMMAKPQRQIKMLIGLPGVGKSTYIKEHPEQFAGYTFISLEDIILKRRDEKNRETGNSYSIDDIINSEIDSLRIVFDEKLREAVERGDNILIEAINDTPSNRQRRLQCAKNSPDYDYHSVAIVVEPPEEAEHVKRLFDRALAEGRYESLGFAQRSKMVPVGEGEFDEVIRIGVSPENPLFHEYGDASNLKELIDQPSNTLKR